MLIKLVSCQIDEIAISNKFKKSSIDPITIEIPIIKNNRFGFISYYNLAHMEKEATIAFIVENK